MQTRLDGKDDFEAVRPDLKFVDRKVDFAECRHFAKPIQMLRFCLQAPIVYLSVCFVPPSPLLPRASSGLEGTMGPYKALQGSIGPFRAL